YDFKNLPDLTPAIDDNLIAYRLDSNNLEIINNIAGVYGHADSLKEAFRYYSRSIKLFPKDDIAHYSRGLYALRMGDSTQAINDFSSAILVPGNSYYSAYLERGKIYSGRNDFQKSLADFTMAISIDSSMPDAYYCKGNVYFSSHYFQSAANDYSIVIRKNDGYFKPSAIYYRSYCYSYLNLFSEACKDWREMLTLGYAKDEVGQLIKEYCANYGRPIKKPHNTLSIDALSKCFSAKDNFLWVTDTFLTKNIYYRTDSVLNGCNYNNTDESATYISTEDNGKDRRLYMSFKPDLDPNYDVLKKEIKENCQFKTRFAWGVFHFDGYSFKDVMWLCVDDSLKTIDVMNSSKYTATLKESKPQNPNKSIPSKKNVNSVVQ
ncbi:MAG TPA: hypothetical protein VNX68_18995, partial [Nitrosopumilaceae archaeon]|nr:hypothetical protein [Nitrosopumilaceae archaeon]